MREHGLVLTKVQEWGRLTEIISIKAPCVAHIEFLLTHPTHDKQNQ